MAKPTKRERKFKATGGVKRRLEKGTITNKGKLRKRGKRSSSGDNSSRAATTKPVETTPKLDLKNDFLGQQNLGDLDLESFFAKATEAVVMADDDDMNVEDDDNAAADDDDHDASSSGDEEESDGEETSEDEKESDKKKVSNQKASAEDSSSSSSSSSSEDSDDEDVDAAEARMKAEMAKMQKADPDFHEFLKENEESLLEFGQDEQEDAEGDDDDDDDDAGYTEETKEKAKKTSGGQIHLTKKVLAELEKGALKSHGIKSLKKLVGAYKSACHLADASSSDGERRPGESGSLYLIDSSKVFDELMLMCLNRCHEEFQYHLLGEDGSQKESAEGDDDEDSDENDESKPLNPKTLEKAEKWTDIRPILHSFFRSTLHVMSEAKGPQLLTFILKALSKYLRFMTPFPRIAESMLKSLTSLWSAALDTSEDYQLVRVNAFFRIRQLALTQPFPFIEDCLKKTYLAYAKRAKFGTAATVTSVLPTLTFMGNCLVELYSLDYHSSYQHAFVYIRQLALLLRTALQKKTSEAMQQVYCWQYMHCLKLWVAVLSAAAPEEDGALMRSLVYPLTEVILGTVRFVPSPTRHMPLRFQCVRLLQQLASATEVFIPTTSLLLDCLDWKEWYMSPKKSKTGQNARGMMIHYMIKLPNDDTLRTHEQLESGMNEFFLLLNREVELYRYSPGFPEFSIRIVQRLRLFAKEVRNPRWRTFARACIETCERYSTWAIQARSKLQQAPKDVQQLECLRPASVKTMRERHQESVDKEQKSLEATASTSSRPPAKKAKGADDEHDNNEDDTKQSSSKRKKKKTKKDKSKTKNDTSTAVKGADEGVLQQQDNVQEGIDWSDDDDE